MDTPSVLRLLSGAIALTLLATAEIAIPRRQQTHKRFKRWPHNVGILGIDVLCVRLILPAGIVGVALFAEQEGLGLLNAISLPAWLATSGAFLFLDLAIYGQHVALHRIPFLWTLHRTHHTDLECDVTTGIRFHPFEILLSLALKIIAVLIIGASATTVLIFEIALHTMSLFNHANIRLPKTLDHALRLVLVTPDMHRVHHSAISTETNSNFGFGVPWWDWMFQTYRAQPELGHTNMAIGLNAFPEKNELRLDRLLTQPFRKTVNPRLSRSHQEN